MKILIAYDGSECGRAAIADLALAGLPETAEARILTLAEVQSEFISTSADIGYGSSFMNAALAVEDAKALVDAARRDAAALAKEGALRVANLFPAWSVEADAGTDSPAGAILDAADRWSADLVVVGSHGRSAVARVFYGSVSQKVVKYSRGSVRVGRGRANREPGAPRLLLALDGSNEAHAAMQSLASRRWPRGTQVCILTVLDVRLTTPLPNTSSEELSRSIQERVQHASEQLQEVGLEVTPIARRGDPKRVILAEAEQWKADCIFVGTHGVGGARRFLLGTVASAVVSRAHCSVEVVRK